MGANEAIDRYRFFRFPSERCKEVVVNNCAKKECLMVNRFRFKVGIQFFISLDRFFMFNFGCYIYLFRGVLLKSVQRGVRECKAAEEGSAEDTDAFQNALHSSFSFFFGILQDISDSLLYQEDSESPRF